MAIDIGVGLLDLIGHLAAQPLFRRFKTDVNSGKKISRRIFPSRNGPLFYEKIFPVKIPREYRVL